MGVCEEFSGWIVGVIIEDEGIPSLLHPAEVQIKDLDCLFAGESPDQFEIL